MINIIAQEKLSQSLESAHPQNDVWYLSTHPKWGNVDNGCQKITQMVKKSGNRTLSKMSQDLLDVAAFLYTADKLIVRNPWVRDLHFVIPVRMMESWDECRDLLVETIARLSGDNISFDFTQYVTPPDDEGRMLLEHTSSKNISSQEEDAIIRHKDCIALFSGGLDSFAGLVKLKMVDGRDPLLVSHSPGPIGGVQRNLLKNFLEFSGNQQINDDVLLQCALGPRRNNPYLPVTKPSLGYCNTEGERRGKMENSQRMRSFLHLSLGVVVAQQLSLSDIYIIDNGILSINLPLVPCRAGSRSTRSTDPLFLKLYQALVSKLYGIKLDIQNPFIFKTKSQIIDLLKDQGQDKFIKDTVSCWAYPRGLKGLKKDMHNFDRPVTHCGYCLPCLIRRMAILTCSLSKYDAGYARDVLANFGEAQYQPGEPDYSKTEHFRDLLYFCARISNIQEEVTKVAKQTGRDINVIERARFLTDFPELSLLSSTVQIKGVNNPLQEAIDMYKRFSKEILDVVQANGDNVVKAWMK